MNGMEDLAWYLTKCTAAATRNSEIRKVLGENFLRAFAQAEKVAGNGKISGQGSLVRIKK
jgi:hypothetical protein